METLTQHMLPCRRLPQQAARADRKHLTSNFRVHALRPDRPSTDVETPLLSALTTIGLSGTIAVTGASLCGIDLFNEFHWDLSDIAIALKYNVPLLFLELLLFAPRWSIPAELLDHTSVPEQRTAPYAAADDAAKSQQVQLVDMSAVKNCTMWSRQNWQLVFALYNSVLRQSQTQGIHRLAAVGLVAARETSKELLQRGFLLTALAHWFTDRFYEAGLDDVVTIYKGFDMTLSLLGFTAACGVMAFASTPIAYTAANEAAESVSGALLLRTEVGQALVAGRSGSSSSSSSSSSSGWQEASGISAAASNNVEQQQQQQQQQEGVSVHSSSGQQQQQPSSTDGDQDEDDFVLDPEVLEYRLFKVTEECVESAAVKLAYQVTLLKEMARINLANSIFAASSGNLATTLTTALLLNGMLLLYAVVAPKAAGSVCWRGKEASVNLCR